MNHTFMQMYAKILRLMETLINCMFFMISVFKFLSQGDLTIPFITSGCHTFCTICSPVKWYSQVRMLLYTQGKSVANDYWQLHAHTAINGLLFTGIDCDTTCTT